MKATKTTQTIQISKNVDVYNIELSEREAELFYMFMRGISSYQVYEYAKGGHFGTNYIKYPAEKESFELSNNLYEKLQSVVKH